MIGGRAWSAPVGCVKTGNPKTPVFAPAPWILLSLPPQITTLLSSMPGGARVAAVDNGPEPPRGTATHLVRRPGRRCPEAVRVIADNEDLVRARPVDIDHTVLTVAGHVARVGGGRRAALERGDGRVPRVGRLGHRWVERGCGGGDRIPGRLRLRRGDRCQCRPGSS